MTRRTILAATLGLLLSGASFSGHAALLSLAQLNNLLPTFETRMETIFNVTAGTEVSQLQNIEFLSVITLPDPASYLHINNVTEQEDLLTHNTLGIPVGPSVITAYIVESVSHCGNSNSGYVGCAGQPGDAFYVEGSFLSQSLGDELFAHELGHTFDLRHDGLPDTNLMYFQVGNNRDDLNEAQIAKLNEDVRNNIVNNTVTIQPVLLTAPVPLPPALLLFGLPAVALTVFGGARRRT